MMNSSLIGQHHGLEHQISLHKVLVLGCPGAGKSTFSVHLSQVLNLPVIHLDQLFWNPGWVQTDQAQFRNQVQSEVAKAKWVMDGNYSRSFDLRLSHADLIVVLDRNVWICLWRVIKRMIGQKLGKKRQDMPDYCIERVDFEFYRWILRFQKDEMPLIRHAIQNQELQSKTIFIKSDSAAKSFLKTIKNRQTPPAAPPPSPT